MKYIEWFEEHSAKHKKIVYCLKHLNKNEIIEYFKYENMQKMHKDFCSLYETGTKCHDIKNLNCYLCGCQYFRFNDNGLYLDNDQNVVFSYCVKGYGNKFITENKIHQDCSKCTIPHNKKFISDNFDPNWKNIMKDVAVK